MEKINFPELEQSSDLELLRTRKELAEMKVKVARYEEILRENELLDSVPVTSDTESLCVRELQRYNELSAKKVPLSLEDIKVIDLLHKNLLMARGKAVPVEKKTKKEEKVDIGKLLKLAEIKE